MAKNIPRQWNPTCPLCLRGKLISLQQNHLRLFVCIPACRQAGVDKPHSASAESSVLIRVICGYLSFTAGESHLHLVYSWYSCNSWPKTFHVSGTLRVLCVFVGNSFRFSKIICVYLCASVDKPHSASAESSVFIRVICGQKHSTSVESSVPFVSSWETHFTSVKSSVCICVHPCLLAGRCGQTSFRFSGIICVHPYNPGYPTSYPLCRYGK